MIINATKSESIRVDIDERTILEIVKHKICKEFNLPNDHEFKLMEGAIWTLPINPYADLRYEDPQPTLLREATAEDCAAFVVLERLKLS